MRQFKESALRDPLMLFGSAFGTFWPRTVALYRTKNGDAMNDEPKKQEPEIMPPLPEVEPERNLPEIPLDKDVPEKKGPIQAEG
jgi:hypothetical protein